MRLRLLSESVDDIIALLPECMFQYERSSSGAYYRSADWDSLPKCWEFFDHASDGGDDPFAEVSDTYTSNDPDFVTIYAPFDSPVVSAVDSAPHNFGDLGDFKYIGYFEVINSGLGNAELEFKSSYSDDRQVCAIIFKRLKSEA